MNTNLRLVLQEQFSNIKVFVLKSPHQWTPLEVQYKSHYTNESTAGADASVEVSKLKLLSGA